MVNSGVSGRKWNDNWKFIKNLKPILQAIFPLKCWIVCNMIFIYEFKTGQRANRFLHFIFSQSKMEWMANLCNSSIYRCIILHDFRLHDFIWFSIKILFLFFFSWQMPLRCAQSTSSTTRLMMRQWNLTVAWNEIKNGKFFCYHYDVCTFVRGFRSNLKNVSSAIIIMPKHEKWNFWLCKFLVFFPRSNGNIPCSWFMSKGRNSIVEQHKNKMNFYVSIYWNSFDSFANNWIIMNECSRCSMRRPTFYQLIKRYNHL